MKRKPDSPQPPHPQIVRRIPDGSRTLTVQITPDARLRRTARWTVQQDDIIVRIPPQMPAADLDRILDDIVARVLRQRSRARRQNDGDLEQRARTINTRYFDGALAWHTIRWVSNMQRRLGSCTEGGATDGDIRISDRIRDWPTYVVDYVIAHELAHRRHPDHSPAFWEYLARYPHMERAKGFIEGIAFAQGDDPDSLI